MWRKSILEWLRHRPWVFVPFLALIPLAALYLNQRSQTEAKTAPMQSTPLASPTSTPVLPLPPPQTSAPQASLKSPTPKPTLTPVDPKKYTKEQAAINERSKAMFAATAGTVDSLI
ncbi:MAG: SpoIID/LytB domain-containing protein, partial [Leptolyngbya sp. ERB_1_2]